MFLSSGAEEGVDHIEKYQKTEFENLSTDFLYYHTKLNYITLHYLLFKITNVLLEVKKCSRVE